MSCISEKKPYGSLPEDVKTLISNFFSLLVLQGANYILPFITLPYLVRVLGVEKFGLIAFAASFINYFIIITDYGFNLSATRDIAINRDSREDVAKIFCSVMIIKTMILFFGFILLVCIVLFFEKLRLEWEIYLITYGLVLGQVVFPLWFFQGMERMKYITVLTLISKTVFAASIFLFVNNKSDYLFVPLINTIGSLFSGLLALWLIRYKFNVEFLVPRFTFIKKTFRSSTQFFLSRVSVSLYTSSNAFVLGIFGGNTAVGLYSAAEKIYLAIQGLYAPICNVLYPFMSKKRNVKLYKKIFYTVCFVNVLGLLFLYVYIDSFILLIFGSDFTSSSNILKIFIYTSVVVVPSVMIGYPFLAAMGKVNYANNSVIVGSFVHVTGLILLSFANKVTAINIVYMVLFSECLVFSIRCYAVKIHKLWNPLYLDSELSTKVP